MSQRQSKSNGKPKPKSNKQPVMRNRMRSDRNLAVAPVATNRALRSTRMSSSYQQTERVGAISTPVDTGFHVLTSLPINPGMPFSFPWLSGHATLFEKYEIKSLTFRFKNLLSTTTNGNVILCFSFDTLDPDPVNALIATQKAAYVDGAVWRETVLNVPIRPKELFTRAGAVPPNADLKTYDYGKLWICTEGVTTSLANIGYLEMSYNIVLRDKSEQLLPYTASYSSSGSIGINSDTYTFGTGTTEWIIPSSELNWLDLNTVAFSRRGSASFPYGSPIAGTVFVNIYLSAITETAFSARLGAPPNQLFFADLADPYQTVPIAWSYAGPVAGQERYYGSATFVINTDSVDGYQTNMQIQYDYIPDFDAGETYTISDIRVSSSWSPPQV